MNRRLISFPLLSRSLQPFFLMIGIPPVLLAPAVSVFGSLRFLMLPLACSFLKPVSDGRLQTQLSPLFWLLLISDVLRQISPAVRSCRCRLDAAAALKAVLRAFLQLQGKLFNVYPALGALGLAAGMAASALNVNGLGIMNKSAFPFFVFFFLLSDHVLI